MGMPSLGLAAARPEAGRAPAWPDSIHLTSNLNCGMLHYAISVVSQKRSTRTFGSV